MGYRVVSMVKVQYNWKRPKRVYTFKVHKAVFTFSAYRFIVDEPKQKQQ